MNLTSILKWLDYVISWQTICFKAEPEIENNFKNKVTLNLATLNLFVLHKITIAMANIELDVDRYIGLDLSQTKNLML